MAKQRKVLKTGNDRHGGESAGGTVSINSACAIPSELHEAIEVERDNLSRAESLLGCLARSMESDCETEAGSGPYQGPYQRPYYPDIAHMARQMVRSSINGLDSLALQRLLERNKVKEDFWQDLSISRYH